MTRNNRDILASIMGQAYPDEQLLEPIGYDLGGKEALAADIQQRGVPVSGAAIVVCEKVGQVLNVMDHPPRGEHR